MDNYCPNAYQLKNLSVLNTSMKKDFLVLEDKLERITDELDTDLSKYITPVNAISEEKKFFEALEKGEEYNPVFEYLPKNPLYSHLKMSPEYKEKLTELTLIQTGEKGVSKLLGKKKQDLIKKMEFIRMIGTEKFGEQSVEFFGKPSKKLVKDSIKELKKKVKPDEKNISAEKMVSELKNFLKKKKIKFNVLIEEKMSADAAVLNSVHELRIRKDAMFSELDVKRLEIHEIETHIYRHLNGHRQPYKLFLTGTDRNWLITEEGLAVANEKLFNCCSSARLKKYAGRVLSVHKSLNNSFYDVFKYLEKFFEPEQAFRIALRSKRGTCITENPGGYTKDYFYSEGIKRINKFLKKGNIEDLYYGKISIEDINEFKSIPELVKPKYLPDYKKVL